MPPIEKLAIFAGAGELPRIAVVSAQKQKIPLVLYHIAETELDGKLAADEALRKRQISVGDLAQTFAYLKDDKITHIALLGKLEKQKILHAPMRDAAAEAIYRNARDRRDDTLFHEFAAAIARMGITILPQKALLDGCFLLPGVHTHLKAESPALQADIEFGYALSQKVGSLDIGQTAIVFEKMVLAIEAIEGTDAAIRRAGELAQKKGGVVCKTAKASQDARFDLPTVGVRTLETMAESGMQALVIESAETLVVNPAGFIARADELGLIVVAR